MVCFGSGWVCRDGNPLVTSLRRYQSGIKVSIRPQPAIQHLFVFFFFLWLFFHFSSGDGGANLFPPSQFWTKIQKNNLQKTATTHARAHDHLHSQTKLLTFAYYFSFFFLCKKIPASTIFSSDIGKKYHFLSISRRIQVGLKSCCLFSDQFFLEQISHSKQFGACCDRSIEGVKNITKKVFDREVRVSSLI